MPFWGFLLLIGIVIWEVVSWIINKKKKASKERENRIRRETYLQNSIYLKAQLFEGVPYGDVNHIYHERYLIIADTGNILVYSNNAASEFHVNDIDTVNVFIGSEEKYKSYQELDRIKDLERLSLGSYNEYIDSVLANSSSKIGYIEIEFNLRQESPFDLSKVKFHFYISGTNFQKSVQSLESYIHGLRKSLTLLTYLDAKYNESRIQTKLI
jgi:hypothetical protein